MKTKRVIRHFCEFCGKGKFSKSWMARHEAHCYKNPERVPYEGELSYIGQTGTYKDFSSEDGPWHEWVEFDPLPKWWPGEGMIFHDGKWYHVPGYRRERAEPGHGCAGGACDTDVYPHELPRIPAAGRWAVLKEHEDMNADALAEKARANL